MRLAIFVLALAACSNLPDYKPVCGNGVIEPHEDCDSGSGCFQCSQTCDANLGCPTGLACGGDFLCHAPGGQFRSMGQGLPFDGEDLFVADVDRDRIGDLVEVSPTALTVLHGQLGVGPSTESVLQTPFVTGRPAVGSFDPSDHTNDVVLPTVHGIAAYTSPQHALSPYPFALDVSLPDKRLVARPFAVWQIDPTHVGMVGEVTVVDDNLKPIATELGYVTIDISMGAPSFGTHQTICSGLAPDVVLNVDVRALSATQQLVAIAGVSKNDASTPDGCVLRIDNFMQAYQVELPGAPGRPIIAAMPGAACPSVFAGTAEYKGAAVTGGCGVTVPPTGLPAPNSQLAAAMPPGDVVIGTVPLVPALANDSGEAIATSHGIYALPTTTSSPAVPIYASDRALTRVTALDIDGDGDNDVVGIDEAMNDLDVLFRFEPSGSGSGSGSGSAMPQPAMEFQLVRYDTTAHPRLMLAGDFDGNHILDLAYSEPVTYGERLLVMYGTSDRPLPPIEMATFRDLVSLLPGNVEPGDASQTLQDLSVLDYDAASTPPRPLLTLMHGSPQRTLFPSYQPNLGGAGQTFTPPPFTSVAMGHFSSMNMGGIADLFSVAQMGSQMFAFFSPATAGAFPIGSGMPPPTADCASDPTALLCAPDIHYLTWNLGIDHDTLIAVAADKQAVTFDPSATPITPRSDAPLFADPFPAGVVLHSLHQLDLDGDGHDELIAAFGADPAQRTASATGTVRACPVDATGVVAGTCIDLATKIGDMGASVCVDAAVAHATDLQIATTMPKTPPPPSLLMLCHRAGASDVFRISYDKAGYHTTRVLHISSATVERIFTGDVNGDAVDDLIALDISKDFLVPQITIYPQCTSRDSDADCERAP